MKEATYVFKNAEGKWASGFPSRQSAVDAAVADGLTQFETASVTTEPPAYFVRFLAPVALREMIDGMNKGEKSGHVVDSREAREVLEKIAAAKLSDGFPPTDGESDHSIDTGSFSEAARQLRVGQPSVSRAIAQLEED
jgi:hypothetical protein